MQGCSFKMEIQPLFKIVTKYILLRNGASPDPKSEAKLRRAAGVERRPAADLGHRGPGPGAAPRRGDGGGDLPGPGAGGASPWRQVWGGGGHLQGTEVNNQGLITAWYRSGWFILMSINVI